MDGAGAGVGGGGVVVKDMELVSKTLQVEHKLFYFDLKENPRGRYLKISEKTSVNRSTIIVPVQGIFWFLDLFNYYVGCQEQDVLSKELQLDTKVFYFDVGDNKRGRFLKISEASVSRNRSTIIIPAGGSHSDGWVAFRGILGHINEENASHQFMLSHQQTSGHIPGLYDDVGAGFIPGSSSSSSQTVNISDLSLDQSVDHHRNERSSKVIRVDQKRFFFYLGNNNRGHFLKISEVAGSDRSSIILPISGLKQFDEMIGHFVKITKDRF
ncbi:Transcription factor Pur-alpha 1 [Zostera marina]|uniref:Transcription factor Pur-alpha 1 n=1 Tax=Zostera marina TaxID=29655 RepID=A0A0K9NX38_ZOSMR|nr:Transcription factor Pur-alpha 1 [Zostera marina]